MFARLVAGGYVYRRRKPIHWCPLDRTALAEAELEYAPRRDPSIYLLLPLAETERHSGDAGERVHRLLAEPGPTAGLLVWTTTPWTLFGNAAVAVHPEADYAVVQMRVGGQLRRAVVAAARCEQVLRALGAEAAEVRGQVRGAELVGLRYCRPYPQVGARTTAPVIAATHVGLAEGTGLVHTAPGHGTEDYLAGLAHGLELWSPVEPDGTLAAEVGPPFAGQPVHQANPLVIEQLRARGWLLAAGELEHSYPHCWRCRTPLIFRATEQWFVSLEHQALRERALRAVREQVQWVPAWGRTRIEGMLAQRPDWCISRQRAWGIPIPVLYCEACGQPLLQVRAIERVRDLVRAHGSGVWFEREAAALLGQGEFRCEQCGNGSFRKEDDIFDVWFESGSSWHAVLQSPAQPELGYPADLYLEGTDQHRGWFQLSLLPALAATGQPPYRTVLTHGFVVDAAGHKMSKSRGNYLSLQDGLEQFSGDILRLWFSSLDYTDDVAVSADLIAGTRDVYRKIRNTFKYLLGNVHDLRGPLPSRPAQPDAIDLWALARLEQVRAGAEEAYEAFRFHRVHRLIYEFCAVDLSALYFEVVRDRLYCDPPASPRRRATQQVLARTLLVLTRLLAPILVFTCEEVWDHLRPLAARWGQELPESVHLADWPAARPDDLDADLLARFATLWRVREEVLREVEKLRKAGTIGAGTAARVSLVVEAGGSAAGAAAGAPAESVVAEQPAALAQLLAATGPQRLAELFGVAEVVLGTEPLPGAVAGEELAALRVRAERAPYPRCERCWILRPLQADGLCARCAEAVELVLAGGGEG
ncbi:MAG: isoleucine--tRNA ligase [Planctomycetota bacterium]|nr:MAG: isoleucine--tRNA ligase [Planctomycetota bacterium]